MSGKKYLIAVVDDDPAFNRMITDFLKLHHAGIVKSFSSGEDCVARMTEAPDIVLQDYEMTGMNGIETMTKMKGKYPNAEYIFLSGQSSITVAVEALKKGAYDYIVKDEHAKETALHKVKQLVQFKKLLFDKYTYRLTTYVLIPLILLTWVFLFWKNYAA